MITISIKIRPEDKRAMCTHIESILHKMSPDTVHDAFLKEELQRICTKLHSGRYNERAVSFNLAQVHVFRHYLQQFYEHLGGYELANTIFLLGEIDKKIRPKILTLQ